MNYRYNTLFLKQSYEQALRYHRRALGDGARSAQWDYVILTASSEEQAEIFRAQLDRRLRCGMLPSGIRYTVVPDPEGKRIGSGGATLEALRTVANELAKSGVTSPVDALGKLRILCIHSGGDSKRLPQYSVCGKLFSPIPRLLAGGCHSTLFDELIMTTLPVAARLRDGMLVCSGDVLLLFDPLQLDLFTDGAAAFSVKTEAALGEKHGVYRSDGAGYVRSFLHKKPISELEASGAIDRDGCVDIDTGAVLLSGAVAAALCSLALSDARGELINERVRLSFYADISYPMSADATLEKYLRETPENTYSDELTSARKRLWKLLSPIRMKLISFSPARFLHLGTTSELLGFMTKELGQYECLGWHRLTEVYSDGDLPEHVTALNSRIGRAFKAEGDCYIENSVISDNVTVGDGSAVSGALVPSGTCIPNKTVIHCLKLRGGGWVARAYGASDDPKLPYHFGRRLERPLWSTELFPIRSTPEEALRATLKAMDNGFTELASEEELISLERSFLEADAEATLSYCEELSERIAIDSYLDKIKSGIPFSAVNAGLAETADKSRIDRITSSITAFADNISPNSVSELALKERIYYCLSLHPHTDTDEMQEKAFRAVADAVVNSTALPKHHQRISAKNGVTLHLPLRVNFGGGWTDTPPYCLERGGCVLNGAVALNGKLPVTVSAEPLSERRLVLISEDKCISIAFGEADCRELYSLTSPGDPLSIHKAALTVCGLLTHPATDGTALTELFDRLGGGLRLTTRVDVPDGSGLGTSSILSGGCIKALHELFGAHISEQELWSGVLSMEQMISTGGGWQDQVGGLTPGIKLITSAPGISQELQMATLTLDKKTSDELEARYAVIYTGQRRLSRSLVRDVMGRYISADPIALDILDRLPGLALQMKSALEKGDIDAFAALLDEHWSLSKALDPESTNECIEAIFDTVAPLICGRMICGAGGGGYLQVVLKREYTHRDLSERLRCAFGDSAICASKCTFIV